MKGYIRLKNPDEEVFLDEGAGCVQVPTSDTLHYRIWDRSQTIFVSAERIVTIRLGTGQRPEGYAPLGE